MFVECVIFKSSVSLLYIQMELILSDDFLYLIINIKTIDNMINCHF